MSRTKVPDTKPDRATLVAVLSAAEGNLLLGGYARRSEPTGRRGPYTLTGAVDAATGGDPFVNAAALSEVEQDCPGRKDCPVCDKDCGELACWIYTDPDLIEVGTVFQAAIKRLSLEAAR